MLVSAVPPSFGILIGLEGGLAWDLFGFFPQYSGDWLQESAFPLVQDGELGEAGVLSLVVLHLDYVVATSY